MASNKTINYEQRCIDCRTVVHANKINRDKFKERRQKKPEELMKFCNMCRDNKGTSIKEIKKGGTAALRNS